MARSRSMLQPTGKRKPASAGRPSAGPPAFRPVQLARLVDAGPTGNRWLHEMKYDGYRTLIAVGGGEARAAPSGAVVRP